MGTRKSINFPSLRKELIMGYAKIENLYRRPDALQCFALEKIEGSSANISFNGYDVNYFSGCAKHSDFMNLFMDANLKEVYKQKFLSDTDEAGEFFKNKKMIIYGEVFGQKIQGMKATYGDKLRFLAFDVKLDDRWLNVPSAEFIVKEFGLDFVAYEQGPLTLEWLDEQRDRPSRAAIYPDKPAEGIVIRPIQECYVNGNSRMILKHKRAEFRETKTQREVDPNAAFFLFEKSKIVDEYATPARLNHVLQKTPYREPADIGKIIKAFQADLRVECAGEFEWTRQVVGAIGQRVAEMLLKMPFSQ